MKALIINPFGIGDVLFTTPAIRALKKTWPDIRISYWCNQRVKEIFRNHPDIDKVFAFSRGDLKKIYQKSWIGGTKSSFKLFADIRKEKFDIVIDYSLDHRYGLLCMLAGIKRRVGINYKNRGRFLTEKFDIDGYSGKHAVEYYLQPLEFLGIHAQDMPLELSISENDKTSAALLLRSHGVDLSNPVVGIAAGAGGSWGKDASYKHWPAENFALLAKKLTQECNATCIFLGDASEFLIGDAVKKVFPGRWIDLIGKTSLLQLCAVISYLDILVTNDGGPLHIAQALKIKSVSLFGPVDDMVYGPYLRTEKQVVLTKGLPCQPCYQKFKLPWCHRDRECIRTITVDEVFEGVRRLI